MVIRIEEYGELQAICWNRPAGAVLSPEDALATYESNWRHVRQDRLTAHERALIDTLIHDVGHGAFLG